MYFTEFLNRTNRRQLNAQIDFMVQRRLQECAEDLEQRRMQLAQQLQNEALQLNEELAELQQAQADAIQNQRIEWIQMAVMNREREEEKLLKQKQQQREIECSEEHRHLETKEILLESKRAQLYQIEERKAMKWRETGNWQRK